MSPPSRRRSQAIRRAAPSRAWLALAGITLAGTLLVGGFGLAGGGFDNAQRWALLVLFVGCAASIAHYLVSGQCRSLATPTRLPPPSAGAYCAASMITAAAASLATFWVCNLTQGVSGTFGTGGEWLRQGYGPPVLVSLFVGVPLMTGAWLGFTRILSSTTCPRTRAPAAPGDHRPKAHRAV